MIIQCQPTDVGNVCETVDPLNDDNATTSISINSTNTFTQFECVRNYEVTVDSANFLDRYLMFEIYFQNFSTNQNFRPLLMVESETLPQLILSSSGRVRISADNYDRSGFGNRKTYHSLVISPEDITAIGDKFYFSLYYYTDSTSNYVDATTEYQVKVTSTYDFPCPQDCTSDDNGYCDQNLKKCVCKRGYFDVDCSVQATEFFFSNMTDVQVSPDKPTLLFTDKLGDPNDSLKVMFNKTQGSFDLYFKVNQENNFTLPNPVSYLTFQNFPSTTNGSYMILPELFLSFHKESTLLINVYNPESTSNNIKMSIQHFDEGTKNRETLMEVMMGVSAMLIVFWAVVTIVKYKGRGLDLLQNVGLPVNDEEREVLNDQDLDRYFVKKAYKEHKSSYPQKTCSICLEDFQSESICRQLYCEHTFHDKCIEGWLHQHDTCPMCKKPMTKEAIEKHLAEAEAKPIESAPDSSIPLKKFHERSNREIDPFEEEKEDKASPHNINIKIKDEYFERRSIEINMEEVLTLKREKRSNSQNKSYLRIPENRRAISFRDGSMQSEIIDLDDNGTNVRLDVSGNIGARIAQKESKDVGDKNPLAKYKSSANNSPQKDDDLLK